MIHQVDDAFVISSHQVWIPGCYESRAVAQWAFQFPNEVLQRLQEEANERAGGVDGIITKDDLRRAKKARS